jgi:hypothetical protein
MHRRQRDLKGPDDHSHHESSLAIQGTCNAAFAWLCGGFGKSMVMAFVLPLEFAVYYGFGAIGVIVVVELGAIFNALKVKVGGND